MKTYIADIIPQIQRFSQKLDNLTLLINQHWVIINEITESKTVYIFRTNNDLLIVINGKVTKARWEYIGNNSILIDNKSDSYLFKHGFFDENILALKIDSKDEYAFLVNENKYGSEINSIDKAIRFLNSKYAFQELKKNEYFPHDENIEDYAPLESTPFDPPLGINEKLGLVLLAILSLTVIAIVFYSVFKSNS